MTPDTARLAADLEAVFGVPDPSFPVIAAQDPQIAATYVELARAANVGNPLDARERALIHVALNASVVHLHAPLVRLWIRAALGAGATAGEIREVLQLTSVLGIHGTIPGTQILQQAAGGYDTAREGLGEADRIAADRAAETFRARRGALTPAWQTNCLYVPGLVEAYAAYSAVPWDTSHLSGKMKELVYVAIDLAPNHVHLAGATVHMTKARQNHGCTEAEIVGVLKLIALMGFQTHMLALPILAEELARAAVAP